MSDALIWNILNRNLFFVKNAVRASEAKTSDKLDVYDPQTGSLLLECREPDIGMLTKLGRLFGGRHDRGTPFNLVALIPDNGPQVLRAARGSATLTFGGPAIAISDHHDELLGSLKRKPMALGRKFNFSPKKDGDSFVLDVKSNFFGGDRELFISEKKVAALARDWRADHADYFQKEVFAYAFSISPEVPQNNRVRQILLAFAVAQHRVDI
jgi:hypothetical protein